MRKNAVEAKLEDQTVEGFETVTNPKFEVYTDKAGEFRFRLKSRNGEIIAVSEGYKAKASCLNGIESVRKNAPDAPGVVADEFVPAPKERPVTGSLFFSPLLFSSSLQGTSRARRAPRLRRG